MDEIVRFNNQTAGRDKVFRLAQYISRILWYSLEQRQSCQINAAKAKRVDEALGLMRRLLRFGRFFETFHSALPVMSSVSDPVIRMTSVLSRLSSSCFMLIDHIVCLDKLGVLKPQLIDAPRWDRTSTRFWLYSIILGLIRDFYDISRIYREEYQHLYKRPSFSRRISKHTSHRRKHQGSSTTATDDESSDAGDRGGGGSDGLKVGVEFVEQARDVCRLVLEHGDVAVDTLKNLCDLLIPLTVLGFIKLNPRTIGLVGVVSTVASALPQINPMIKMVPAT